ncbi:conserved hypothetical protein [Desulfosarcina cetonica]|uniref:hypothetical protein n=1 Tax=Desulfosarcina cetonica TaxID=90730 RepID=UPI0006D2667A|nr:hypothetical protein [Desulfosarcina cetonica]VTR66924.1 conserved hypothetical protein [Desulfosarcina cetonica]
MENDYEWDYIEQEIWKPTDDQNTIVGKLVGKEPKGDNIGARYYIENESGRHLVWGSSLLDAKLHYVAINEIIKIKFLGKSKGRQGQDINGFAVAVGKAVHPAVERPATDRIEVFD